MDFYAVVDQVVALLRQRGRVSYRALKVQFDLDDEQLDALKEELLYAHQRTVEEDGRCLVWTGGRVHAGTDPEARSTSAVAERPDEPRPEWIATSEPRAPDAERRQLTVLFCDLVDSTALRASSIPKTGARWCGPIKRPAPR